MRILITGADGFVGQAVSRILAGGGHEIIKVKGPGAKRRVDGKNELAVDVAKKDEVEQLAQLKDISAIIHCAGLAHQPDGRSENDFYKVNVGGTCNIVGLGAILEVGRLIIISSTAVYGNVQREKMSETGLSEEDACDPRGFYAQSKYRSEKRAIELSEKHNLNLTVLRPATVIGEGDRANYYRLMKAIGKRRFVRVGKGVNRKSLIYKDDVGRACQTIVEQSRASLEIYNLAAEPLPVRKIVETISGSLGAKVPVFSFPPSPFKFFFRLNEKTFGLKSLRRIGRTLEKWLAEDVFAADEIKRQYGFTPEVSAVEALERECQQYLREQC